MKRRHPRAWSVAAAFALLVGTALAAPPAAPRLTLEQAIARVQQDTGGTVLSAESRELGRRTEYRIKVLTPEGHVLVIVLSSDGTRNSMSKNPAAHGSGNKEIH